MEINCLVYCFSIALCFVFQCTSEEPTVQCVICNLAVPRNGIKDHSRGCGVNNQTDNDEVFIIIIEN